MNIQLLFGWVSLVLILLAGFMHCRRVAQGVIVVNPISWFVWFGVSFAILISYISIGSTYNTLAAIGNVIFPGINFFFAIRQKEKVPLVIWDYLCALLGVISLIAWYFTNQNPAQAQYANYIAIVADLCAVIPTYRFVKGNPMKEKPLPWLVFSIGFGLSCFAVTTHTVANYVLPVYMFIGAGSIAYLQIRYRMLNNIKEKWY